MIFFLDGGSSAECVVVCCEVVGRLLRRDGLVGRMLLTLERRTPRIDERLGRDWLSDETSLARTMDTGSLDAAAFCLVCIWVQPGCPEMCFALPFPS